jgi:hypothetical protein
MSSRLPLCISSPPRSGRPSHRQVPSSRGPCSILILIPVSLGTLQSEPINGGCPRCRHPAGLPLTAGVPTSDSLMLFAQSSRLGDTAGHFHVSAWPRRPWLNLMLAASNAQRAEIFAPERDPRQPFLIRSGARVPQMIHKWWAAAVPCCPSESSPARGERYVRKSGSPSGSRWRWEPPVPPPDKNHDTGKPCLCWVESGRRWHRVAAGDRSRFGFHVAAGQLPVTELAFHKFWGTPNLPPAM